MDSASSMTWRKMIQVDPKSLVTECNWDHSRKRTMHSENFYCHNVRKHSCLENNNVIMRPMMQAEPAANQLPYTLAQEPTHGLLKKTL